MTTNAHDHNLTRPGPTLSIKLSGSTAQVALNSKQAP